MGSHRIRRLAVTLCFLVVAAACSGTNTTSATESTPPDGLASVDVADNSLDDVVSMTQINVAALRTIDSSPLWVAQSQGFFSEAGIEIEFVSVVDSVDVLNALLDGRADVIAAPPTPVLKRIAEGEPLRIVNYLKATSPQAERNSMTLVTTASTEIASGCDLENLNVGVDQVDSLVVQAVIEMVKNDGCDPATVVFVEESLNKQLDSLEEGSVSAIGLFEPYTARATRREFVEVANLDRELCSGVPRCPLGIVAMQDDWQNNNAELAEQFNEAVNDAIAWIEQNQIEYRAELVICCGVSPDDAADLRIGKWIGDATSLDSNLTRLMDVLEGQNQLPNRPDMVDVLS